MDEDERFTTSFERYTHRRRTSVTTPDNVKVVRCFVKVTEVI